MLEARIEISISARAFRRSPSKLNFRRKGLETGQPEVVDVHAAFPRRLLSSYKAARPRAGNAIRTSPYFTARYFARWASRTSPHLVSREICFIRGVCVCPRVCTLANTNMLYCRTSVFLPEMRKLESDRGRKFREMKEVKEWYSRRNSLREVASRREGHVPFDRQLRERHNSSCVYVQLLIYMRPLPERDVSGIVIARFEIWSWFIPMIHPVSRRARIENRYLVFNFVQIRFGFPCCGKHEVEDRRRYFC